MSKPAILLITCDELRKDALGCYGNTAIHTPNIDRLAGNGTRFERAYTVSPWCLPARCAILTGLYPHHSGAYSNFRKCALDNGLPNLFTELKKNGYSTSLFGKCHFAPVPYDVTKPDQTLPYEEFRQYYLSLGIDHLDLQDDKQVSVWFMDDYSRKLEQAGYLDAYRRAVWDETYAKVFPFPAPAQWHPDAWVGQKAAQYIQKLDHDDAEFMWVSFSGPHYPFDAPEEYLSRVDPDRLPEMHVREGELKDEKRIHHKAYYGGGGIDGSNSARDHACKNYSTDYWERLRISYHANVALIDDAVGSVLQAAYDKFGENLLVVFTADHGEMLGNHGMWGKHNCGYEDVLNIPLIVQGMPEKWNGVTHAVVNSTDLMPTFLAAAGAEGCRCDGENIEQLLEKEGRRLTFAEGEGFVSVVRSTDKYIHIRQGDDNHEELHDLRADPLEYSEYSGEPGYLQILAELRGEVVNHFISTTLP